MVKIIHEKDFDTEIKDGLVLVDFYADWCGPCKMLAPVLEEISDKHKDLKVLKVNTDQNQSLTMKYGVSSIPAIFLFKDGKIIDQAAGFMPAPVLESFIKKHQC